MNPDFSRAYSAQRLESFRRDERARRLAAIADTAWAILYLIMAGTLLFVGILG